MTTLVLCCADLSTSYPFGYSALQDVANFLASQAPTVDPETVKFSTTFPRYVGHIFYILFYWVVLAMQGSGWKAVRSLPSPVH